MINNGDFSKWDFDNISSIPNFPLLIDADLIEVYAEPTDTPNLYRLAYGEHWVAACWREPDMGTWLVYIVQFGNQNLLGFEVPDKGDAFNILAGPFIARQRPSMINYGRYAYQHRRHPLWGVFPTPRYFTGMKD